MNTDIDTNDTHNYRKEEMDNDVNEYVLSFESPEVKPTAIKVTTQRWSLLPGSKNPIPGS